MNQIYDYPLYTGRDNPAKYIYLSAGFNVLKSFSTIKKLISHSNAY